jgi:hypothetical protein
MNWRQRGSLWCLRPSRARGLVEFIGGSYLAATPQISYRRFLETLAAQDLIVHAWSYVPGFDHQAQANEAWRAFRQGREAVDQQPRILRLGHSLGCKLHLLAPDNGRNCSALAAMSFNNFSAERSVPLLAELGPRLGVSSEFSPSPQETLELVGRTYQQERNLLVRFQRDGLDQSARLMQVLQGRQGDQSALLERPGDHLSPASAGLRQNLLGRWADDPARQREMEQLAGQICRWWLGPDQTRS